jgi:hypothetical protein
MAAPYREGIAGHEGSGAILNGGNQGYRSGATQMGPFFSKSVGRNVCVSGTWQEL